MKSEKEIKEFLARAIRQTETELKKKNKLLFQEGLTTISVLSLVLEDYCLVDWDKFHVPDGYWEQ